MLHQLHNIPRTTHFVLACSAGVDSMCAADFYKRGGKKFTLAYFDHGTGNSRGAIPVLQEWSKQNDVRLVIGKISGTKPKHQSPEEFWRNERYRWLVSLDINPIITAHHLDDAAETYLFSAMHGNPTLIKSCSMLSYYGHNITCYRPFLTNTKKDFINWCKQHSVKWFEDISNQDIHFPRNRIRHNILPEALKINPGFLKVIKKKYLSEEFVRNQFSH